jgi:hypothetical protein
MKNLLIVTSAIEAATGILLMALPLLVITILLGSVPDSPVLLTVARVAGVALFAIGIACWYVSRDEESRATRGIVSAIAIYNTGITAVFVYGALGLGLSSIGLWPVTLIHTGMTIWSISCLLHSKP